VGSAFRGRFDELSHSGMASHHHLMRQEKSDETVRNSLKKGPETQPKKVKRKYS
jgi:hypothetical protein